MIGQSAEKVYILQLPFRREVAPDAPARIENARPRRLWKFDKMDNAVPGEGSIPGSIVEIK